MDFVFEASVDLKTSSHSLHVPQGIFTRLRCRWQKVKYVHLM